MIQIQKRDGTTEEYDENKVVMSIYGAIRDVTEGKGDISIARMLAQQVTERLAIQSEDSYTSNYIKDETELVLIDPGNDSFEIAKSYIGYRAIHRNIRKKQTEVYGVENDLKLNDNAMNILTKRRYLLPKETPGGMMNRVGNFLGFDIAEKATFRRMLRELEFLPNSPTLMNAGVMNGTRQLSACFVLPIEDSLRSIYNTLGLTALIHQSGGGTGFSFSNIRPHGDTVSTTGMKVAGPLVFMNLYNESANVIQQGGKRHGANMAILRVDHPDIIRFISCKEDPSKLSNFNISVTMTDDFMKQAIAEEDYNTVNPRTGKLVSKLNAKKVLDIIATMAWKNGEPGIIFIDEINRKSPHEEEIEATNPCGEVPLLPFESCNLGSINLSNMICGDGSVDMDKLKSTAYDATIFLNRVIDMNKYPDRRLHDAAHKYRKIGLGVMGFADLLYRLGVRYGSDESFIIAMDIMKCIRCESHNCSEDHTLNNYTTTAIAPTGTISMIAGCSSSIEPCFALRTKEIHLGGQEMYATNKVFEKACKEAMISTDRPKSEWEEWMRTIFVTAHEIPWQEHLKMQQAFQKHTDNAVSKTINLPNSARIEDVLMIYEEAWKMKLKGLTVYRDGSRDGQVLQECPTGVCDIEN